MRLKLGKKLYEEFLTDEERLKETSHKKIFIAKASEFVPTYMLKGKTYDFDTKKHIVNESELRYLKKEEILKEIAVTE